MQVRYLVHFYNIEVRIQGTNSSMKNMSKSRFAKKAIMRIWLGILEYAAALNWSAWFHWASDSWDTLPLNNVTLMGGLDTA